ncbi:MAG: undecaprenyl/decaprenyl-phosphate alpha-N-acetylglucosaminyl 1-phosphate transferase [Bacteroidales bacterium]|nr:undecaprenyl/decaprenyl-phosphate alpha-N-acetylglucosaminyl 1-phosphate transferase [Bacteroidales bacterium]
MNWLLIVALLASILISLFLGSFLIKGSFSFLSKKSLPNSERFGSQSKPIYGGILFYTAFLIFCVGYFFSPYCAADDTNSFVALMITIGISFFMGLADDLLSTPPLFKSVVQFLCAFILIKTGIIIHISPLTWVNYTITILWVVGIMNSINMLDNMDAITSSISLTIIVPCVIMQMLTHDCNIDTAVMITVAGALLGFLRYNWAPAKMYMGDNGSQFLGIFLAYVGIKYFWNGIQIVGEMNYAYNTIQFVMVASAFIVPLSDTTTVTINRLLQGKSPFVGGRDHTTHYLFYRGLSTRMVAVTLIAFNLVGVCISQFLTYYIDLPYWSYYCFLVYPLAVFLFLYINTRVTKQK